MSLEAILAAIERTAETEAQQILAEAESQAQAIGDKSGQKAAAASEEARRAALRPAAGERARELHQARLEGLRLIGEIRHQLVDTALAEVRQRLGHIRDDPSYPLIMRWLLSEALLALGDKEMNSSQPVLEVDPRDEALLADIITALDLDLPLVPSLNCWGGVMVRSGDRLVVVNNTLEARFERAVPFLRQDLAAFFEKKVEDASPVVLVPVG